MFVKMQTVETSALTCMIIGISAGDKSLIVFAATWWLVMGILNVFFGNGKE